MIHLQALKQPTENKPEMTQMLELAKKNFKLIIITMLKGVRENMLTMNEKIENHIREIGTIKKKEPNKSSKTGKI